MSWKPTSTIENLQSRAKVFSTIRNFFASRSILEVETPLLCQHTVTDVHIDSFSVPLKKVAGNSKSYYLQTSPEYAMKRLLAAGSGPIYQMTKSFRDDELGRFHNPEFTMLEWYRPNYNHHQLMDEVNEFLQSILATAPAKRCTYRQLFLDALNVDLLLCDNHSLRHLMMDHAIAIDKKTLNALDRDSCLQLLMSHVIEPKLGFDAPVFIYDFPASQAALAKIRHEEFPVAERFEVYIQGIEIANGFHELTDPKEQLNRFAQDQTERKNINKAIPQIDSFFIESLQHGLPECSGVALGIDRLIMIKTKAEHIREVMSFTWDCA